MPNISGIVKSIQDIMRKDAGTYGDAQRLEQLGWMFFLKIFDDREKEMQLLRDTYRSPLPDNLRWSAWAADEEGVTGEALLDFVNNALLPKLKSLTVGGDKISGLIRMSFEDANNYMKNGTLMRQVINKINAINFNASDDRHMFGDIYEKLLKDLQSAGNAGEFYTPRAVTQFIVEQVNPRLGETILDPACGTGGFLVCAIEHLRKQAKSAADEQRIQDCFAGIEKKHLPHVLCMRTFFLLWQNRVPKICQQLTGELSAGETEQQPAAKLAISESSSRKLPFTLSWTHYVLLLTIKNPEERSFYEIEATNAGWSVPELKRQKASALYQRLALSRDKAGVKRLAAEGQIVTRPEDVLKEPYALEFLGLKELLKQKLIEWTAREREKAFTEAQRLEGKTL
ncbi:HsdM N-terminal domain-containing protein [Desulfonatronum zhilinae]|nr:HsdM N-terminal domain-containing protein [Desulfonatronum zhilinae]